MVFSIHDFTDSEGESDDQRPAQPMNEPNEAASVIHTPEPSETSLRMQDSPPRAGPSTDAHPLRVTLRPNLTHLMNSEAQPDPSKQHSDRSSLSPPPPITLRLGMKHVIAEKAAYSSSSSDDEDRPSPSASHKVRLSPTKKIHPPPVDAATALPAQHRKSYDWLQPSVASASHHGPPERAMPKIMGWSPSDEASEPREGRPKKSHKRRPDGSAPGPGKAWRKGLKKSVQPRSSVVEGGKGMPAPWREGAGLLHEMGGGPSMATPPGGRTPLSQEGTPEPPYDPSLPRPPSPPFVLADPSKLGFPVFAKPIAAPKVTLGPFPKVTQFFAPNNGGDTGRFPRREKVRTWKYSQRTVVGVGGGHLKFKTWTKGPPSELGRLIQADKEAKELTRHRPKATAPVEMPAAFTTAPWDRPPMAQHPSFESATPEQRVEDEERPVSDVGDGDEGMVGSAREGDTPPAKRRGAKGGKAKPRKSKLAQEIHPIPTDAITSEPVS